MTSTGNICIDLSTGWQFIRQKMSRSWLGGWVSPEGESVTLPHCWNTDDTFQMDVVPYAGWGTYRTCFRLPGEVGEGSWLLESEGFYGLAEIWLNGARLARVDGQYLGFQIDCSAALQHDRENLLAIRLSNDCPRYVLPGHRSPDFLLYGGLTGRLRLVHRPHLHLDRGSIAVRTVTGSDASATVTIAWQVRNSATRPLSGDLEWRILDSEGVAVASSGSLPVTVPAAGSGEEQRISLVVPGARLWGLDSPVLYCLQGKLDSGDDAADRVSIDFGIRTAEFTSEGFFLNGERVRLQGCNRHESMPGFGQALPKRLQRRDAALIKELGCNFVRLSHYPQHRWFLDACDRLGLLVYAEIATWKSVRSGRWLAGALLQMEGMVRRDRNHPSIVIWGMGNESRSRKAYQLLRSTAMRLDPTRPVSYAENHLGRARLNKVAGIPDVWGINYGLDEIELAAASSRLGCALVTECLPYCAADRGSEQEVVQVETLADSLQRMDRFPPLAGYAIWAFSDYATMHLNRFRRFSGLFDAWRLPKYSSVLMRARLSAEPFVQLCGPWGAAADDSTSDAEPETRRICVFSNCDRVTISSGDSSGDEVLAELGPGLFHCCVLPYRGGELCAVGERQDGTAEHRLVAFAAASRLELELEGDIDDEPPLAVAVRVVDEQGRQVRSFNGAVNLAAAGAGRLHTFTPDGTVRVARGSGRTYLTPTDHTGAITVAARHPELQPASLYCRAGVGPAPEPKVSVPSPQPPAGRRRARRVLPVKKAILITRTLLGLLLVVLALDSLLHFLPQRQIGGGGEALLAAMADTGYLAPFIAGVGLIAGVCLLAGYFAPLALAMLAPVLVNLVLFHLFLDPGGLPVALLLLVLELFLLWGYRDYFEELLQAKPQVW